MSGRISDERLEKVELPKRIDPKIDELAKSISGLCHTVIAKRLEQFFEVIADEIRKLPDRRPPINDERLLNTRAWAAARPDMSGSEVIISAIDELVASRALVTELRALAEEISSIQKSHRAYGDFSQGQKDARGYWLERIEALIAAHDAQQAHREPKS